jgi:hypothetical protein
MLAAFCLRLALGLLASLLLLSPKQLHPRFFRTHFLTALGLCVVAFMASWMDASSGRLGLLAGGVVLTLAGSLVWTLEPAPYGRTVNVLAVVLLAAAVVTGDSFEPWTFYAPHAVAYHGLFPPLLATDALTAAALLGSALTAMLIGHSYLISPGMALTPLMRLLAALFASTFLRALVAGVGLWVWSGEHDLYNLNDETVLWLPVRWLVGLAGPLVFGWMAYASARIRSTQSATGILYVAVICCFLGELLSLLLTRQTGLPL